jgi:allantoin racemase
MRIWHQNFSDLDLVPSYWATLREHASRVLPPGDAVELHGLRPGTYGPGFRPDPCDPSSLSGIPERNADLRSGAYGGTGRLRRLCPRLFLRSRTARRALTGRHSLRRPVGNLHAGGLFAWPQFRTGGAGGEPACAARGADPRIQPAGATGGRGDDAAADREYMLEADDDVTQPILAAFEQACRPLVDAGAEVVIPGDGFLKEFVWRHDIQVLHGAPVMDALGMLFRYAGFMAGARAALGLQVSRVGFYITPSRQVQCSCAGAARRRGSGNRGGGVLGRTG